MYIIRYLIFVCILLFVSCKESVIVTDKSAHKEQLTNSKQVAGGNSQENENFKILFENGELRIFEIINCDLKLEDNGKNSVFLSDSVNTIFETWNHIASMNDEWEGITKPASNFIKLSNKKPQG